MKIKFSYELETREECRFTICDESALDDRCRNFMITRKEDVSLIMRIISDLFMANEGEFESRYSGKNITFQCEKTRQKRFKITPKGHNESFFYSHIAGTDYNCAENIPKPYFKGKIEVSFPQPDKMQRLKNFLMYGKVHD